MKRILLLATVTLSLWSCSQDSLDADNPTGGAIAYDPAKVVTITTDLMTRGTPISDESQMTDIGVFCSYTGSDDWTTADEPDKMFNTKLLRNTTTGAWLYDGGTPEYWNATSSDDRYTFFAYAPYATTDNGIDLSSSATDGGIPTLTYTVPTDVEKQPDLMVAVAQKNIRPLGNPVRLQMEHALTCVGFQIAASSQNEKISKITITGVSMTGTLAMDGTTIAWSNLGPTTSTNFSASLNYDDDGSGGKQTYFSAKPAMSDNLLAGDGYLMMIPQTLTTNAKIIIEEDNGNTRSISLDTYEWEAGTKITYNITLTETGTITVAPSTLKLPYFGVNASTHNFQVICNDLLGNDVPGLAWTISVPATDTWFGMSLDNTATSGAQTLSGTGTQTIYTFATTNTSTTEERTTQVSLAGSPATVVVNVTQAKDPGTISGAGTVLSPTYVGAFWRKSETGERVIKITVAAANAGAWAAKVYWVDDRWISANDIILSSEDSSDSNLYTATPGNAELFQVTAPTGALLTHATSGTVAADGDIQFRIGLSGAYAPSAAYPARYAVVLLSYKDYTLHQKIFLRQGEEADYLMKNGDKGTTSLTTGIRPYAMKFSPYNLTAPEYKTHDASAPGGTTIANHAQIPARETIATADNYFTDYPTQAGAFFQWAVDPTMTAIDGNDHTFYERRAYHPTAPIISISILNWYNDNAFPTGNIYWNQNAMTPLSAVNETCPPGWRRPNDGSTTENNTTGDVANSEMRQSLWWNPETGNGVGNTDNSLWGYYADGYFDRRAIETSVANKAASTVSASSSTPAYRGRLFFNPTTNASLFMPATGYRQSNSQLVEAGSIANYWTSSSIVESGQSGWLCRVNSGNATSSRSSILYGAPIRCVLDPLTPSFTVDDYTPNPTDLK